MTGEAPEALRGTAPAEAAKSGEPEAPALSKLALDLGPLLIFFGANAIGGIYVATGVFMAATLVALVAQRILHEKVSPLPIVTAGLVLVFGGLTLWLQNETFIKVKPTVLYLLFAGVLAGGLLSGRSLLPLLLGQMLRLTDEGWRLLTWRWVAFFVAMALLNEAVWRLFSTDIWVAFKTFAVLPLTLVFALAQSRLIERNALAQDPSDASGIASPISADQKNYTQTPPDSV
jgi:intracellular septation protein